MQKRKKLAKVKSKRTTKRAPRKWYAGKATPVNPIERHEDERGVFMTVANVKSFGNPIGAVAVLTRKKGSTFAEHTHKKEGHVVFVVSGLLRYRERHRGRGVVQTLVGEGFGVFTPPNRDHAFLALEDTTAVVVANISRTQAEYESDVRRLIDDKRLFSDAEVKAEAVWADANPEVGGAPV